MDMALWTTSNLQLNRNVCGIYNFAYIAYRLDQQPDKHLAICQQLAWRIHDYFAYRAYDPWNAVEKLVRH